MKLINNVIGVMAGSSMDGIDVVCVDFMKTEDKWNYSLKESVLIPYDNFLKQQLKQSATLSTLKRQKLDMVLGEWIAKKVLRWKTEKKISPEVLCIHGHTVEHDPQKGISWQLGDGQTIAQYTNIPTITEFRTADILLGGQGAPLVPMGDFTLFAKYDMCLNLGGIANVSHRNTQKAWDVCPCNQILNFFAHRLGYEYDDRGDFAKLGKQQDDFLVYMQQHDYFKKVPPKSLANNLFDLNHFKFIEPVDGLYTATHFISRQISNDLYMQPGNTILVTGGGVYNDYLITLLKNMLPKKEIILPDNHLIQYKEAIVFAFLGVLKLHNQYNVLASVTGASKNSCSGKLYWTK